MGSVSIQLFKEAVHGRTSQHLPYHSIGQRSTQSSKTMRLPGSCLHAGSGRTSRQKARPSADRVLLTLFVGFEQWAFGSGGADLDDF